MKIYSRNFVLILFMDFQSVQLRRLISLTLVRKIKKGISILIALVTTAMMMGFVADIIVTSAVNVELAMANRDRVKSEYLAKSGFNLGVFLLSLSWAVDLFRAQDNTPESFKAPLVDSEESMWNMFNSLPIIGADSVALIDSMSEEQGDIFNLKGILNEDVSKMMSYFEDNFSLRIHDEGSKININDCSVGQCPTVIQSLEALFSLSSRKSFFRK